MTRSEKKKRFLIYAIVFVAIAILVKIWFLLPEESAIDTLPIEDSEVEDADEVVLSTETCESAGGTWNACGSACRTNPDAVCIELCVAYCECESDAQCPEGLVCGDFVDEVGVCL